MLPWLGPGVPGSGPHARDHRLFLSWKELDAVSPAAACCPPLLDVPNLMDSACRGLAAHLRVLSVNDHVRMSVVAQRGSTLDDFARQLFAAGVLLPCDDQGRQPGGDITLQSRALVIDAFFRSPTGKKRVLAYDTSGRKRRIRVESGEGHGLRKELLHSIALESSSAWTKRAYSVA